MALALRHPTAAVKDGWLTSAEVASRLGVTESAIRKRCQTQYGPAGLAEQIGGAWYIHPMVDILLADDGGEARDKRQLVELRRAGVSARHLAIAELKRDLVLEFLAFEKAGPGDRRELYIRHLFASRRLPADGVKKLKPRALSEWKRDYGEGGLAALVRKARNAPKADVIGDKARAYLVSMLLSGNGLSFPTAYGMTVGYAAKQDAAAGWHIGKQGAVRRAIGKLPRVARRIANKGPLAAKAECEAKMPRDFEAIAAGDEYNCDTCTIDVHVRYRTSNGWRHTRQVYITAVQDMRSRMIVGYVVKPFGDTETILGAVKISFRQFGKPLILRTDWGKDYRAATRPKSSNLRAFDGTRIAPILDRLDVAVVPVTPYSPYTKPIESLFRTLHARLDKLFPSYFGGSPEMRHEDRQEWIERNLEKLPTLRNYCEALAKAIDAYHATPHSAHDLFGKSPAEAMAAFRAGPMRRESDDVLDHFFRRYTSPKRVRRDGVKHHGRWYGHGDPRLIHLLGETVLLGVQPDDASRAMVCRFNDDRTPLFEVECLSARGLTERQLRDAKKAHRDAIKPFAALARQGKKTFRQQSGVEHVEDLAEGIRLSHGDRSASNAPPPAASLRYRPELEEPIAQAGAAPSDAVDSKSVRTGTDDRDIQLADVLDPVQRSDRDHDDDDGLSLSDLMREDL